MLSVDCKAASYLLQDDTMSISYVSAPNTSYVGKQQRCSRQMEKRAREGHLNRRKVRELNGCKIQG